MPVSNVHNEKEVLERLAAGDELAFRWVYDHYRNKIFSMAFRVTGSEAIAQDVIQDIFVKLWVNRDQLPFLRNFNAYLNTIIRNHLSNRFRKLAIQNTYVKYLLEGKEQLVNKVTDQVLYREISRLHKEAINQLTPQQQKVYLMGKQDGLKYDQIASELHISKDTVKEYMTDAMRSVRLYLTTHEYELTVLSILVSARAIC